MLQMLEHISIRCCRCLRSHLKCLFVVFKCDWNTVQKFIKLNLPSNECSTQINVSLFRLTLGFFFLQKKNTCSTENNNDEHFEEQRLTMSDNFMRLKMHFTFKWKWNAMFWYYIATIYNLHLSWNLNNKMENSINVMIFRFLNWFEQWNF